MPTGWLSNVRLLNQVRSVHTALLTLVRAKCGHCGSQSMIANITLGLFLLLRAVFEWLRTQSVTAISAHRPAQQLQSPFDRLKYCQLCVSATARQPQSDALMKSVEFAKHLAPMNARWNVLCNHITRSISPSLSGCRALVGLTPIPPALFDLAYGTVQLQ